MQAHAVISYQYLTNFVAWLPSTMSKLGTLFIESFSKVFGVTWCFACLLKPLLSLHNYKGSFLISVFVFFKPVSKIMDKHVLQKRSRKHDDKLHIETCCDFFIKYLYMKGNSKKHRVSFPGRFLLRNEKMLVYGLKNRG